jgi:ABC-type nitrate/sulfonate/bicarbonate transport system substrate-binding protein
MKKYLSWVLILALLTGLIAGCGDPKDQNPPSEARKTTALLDWVPNTNHTGLYVAKDKGYFEKQGLDVEISQPGDAGAVALVASGKADFGVSYQEEVTMARAQGIPVVAIAAVIQHNTSGFAAPVDRGIKSPADFAGQRYGGWGSPSEAAVLDAVMKKSGADPKKVSMVNIGSADFFSAVQRDIDFSWIFWGWTGIEAEQRGMKLDYIPVKDLDPALDYYTPVLITSEKMVKESPDVVAAFMKGATQGYEFCMDKPEEAAGILLRDVPELNRDLVVASQKYLAGEYQSDAARWGEMKPEIWKGYADWLSKNGVLDKQVDTTKAFTNEFLPEGE